MKEVNKKAIILYLMLTILATLAFGNVIHTAIFSLPISQDLAATFLTRSLPSAIPYANIVSIIYVLITHLILS